MGCLQTKVIKEKRKSSSKKKFITEEVTYSWDNKVKIDPKDYMLSDIKSETIGKLPGSINGQQFIIESCDDANLFLLDYIDSVTIDDCKNCNIVLGPTKGSVFLRNCQNCRFVVACQQFRTRDCDQVDVFLCCATQPVIESSTEMRFGCYCYFYESLESQFHNAGLSVFNNNWFNIHDFTPVDDNSNWTLLPLDARVDDFLPVPTTEALCKCGISTESVNSVVPQTNAPHKIASKENTLVVFFSDGQATSRAFNFISEAQSSCMLVRTKEVILHQSQAELIFGTSSYNNVVTKSPVIALHYNGENSVSACENTAMAIATESGSTGLVYVTTNSRTATRQVEDFFNITDVQMSS